MIFKIDIKFSDVHAPSPLSLTILVTPVIGLRNCLLYCTVIRVN